MALTQWRVFQGQFFLYGLMTAFSIAILILMYHHEEKMKENGSSCLLYAKLKLLTTDDLQKQTKALNLVEFASGFYCTYVKFVAYQFLIISLIQIWRLYTLRYHDGKEICEAYLPFFLKQSANRKYQKFFAGLAIFQTIQAFCIGMILSQGINNIGRCFVNNYKDCDVEGMVVEDKILAFLKMLGFAITITPLMQDLLSAEPMAWCSFATWILLSGFAAIHYKFYEKWEIEQWERRGSIGQVEPHAV